MLASIAATCWAVGGLVRSIPVTSPAKPGFSSAISTGFPPTETTREYIANPPRIANIGADRDDSDEGDFNAAFTVPPFQTMQLRDPAIHTVLGSVDLLGPSTAGVAWTTKRFCDENPKP
jgi:hypothetical protein